MKKFGQFDIPKDVFLRNEQAYKTILNERSFEILRLRTLEDMTYVSIAKLYGLSTGRIQQLCAKSLYKLEQARYEIE